MLRIGNHLPSSKGYLAMGKHAVKLGATTFAFFTRNPRGGTAKPIAESDVQTFLAFAKEHDIDHLVAHAPYTMNLCSAKPDIRQFGLNMLQDDMKRMEYTPHQYYNFHPGSHTEQGMETGIRQIAETLNAILRPEYRTTVLLETMSGKGVDIRRQDGVQRLRDLGNTRLHTLPGVAAGMEVVHVPRQVLHPLQVVRKRHAGKLPGVLILGAGIDGIRRVGHQRAEAVFRRQRQKRRHIRRVDGLGLAAPGIAGEKLKGVGPDGQRHPAHGQKAV